MKSRVRISLLAGKYPARTSLLISETIKRADAAAEAALGIIRSLPMYDLKTLAPALRSDVNLQIFNHIVANTRFTMYADVGPYIEAAHIRDAARTAIVSNHVRGLSVLARHLSVEDADALVDEAMKNRFNGAAFKILAPMLSGPKADEIALRIQCTESSDDIALLAPIMSPEISEEIARNLLRTPYFPVVGSLVERVPTPVKGEIKQLLDDEYETIGTSTRQ